VPGQLQWQRHILLGGQRRGQIERLEHEADLISTQQCQLRLGQVAEIGAGDDDRARRRPVQPGGALQEGALARPGRSHYCRERAAREADRHVPQRRHGATT